MLKSTHRASSATTNVAGQAENDTLPAPWTQHRAPTGHVYYYNPETKQSTYVRPVSQPTEIDEELQIDYGATLPDREVKASIATLDEFNRQNQNIDIDSQTRPGGSYPNTHRHGGARPNRQGDRPKTKTPILSCEPWFLVTTKYRRRFVHNAETKESFWKFPSHVMMAVIDMDRLQREKDEKAEDAATAPHGQEQNTTSNGQRINNQAPAHAFDSDEYEEVEVTDDEDGADSPNQPSSKRPKLHDNDTDKPDGTATGPQEFDEDDIAWQLAQMEAEDDDPGYDLALDDDYDYDQEDDADGLPLTREDRIALFRALLDDFAISPFSTFDALIDTNTPTANAVVSDERWLALPNMSTRRSAFDDWSRDRIASRKAAPESTLDPNDTAHGTLAAERKVSAKPDPRVAYLRFLAQEATPKLYWPEFKRKFRKAPEMTDRYFPDKDREKLYREYVTLLKTSEADRRKSFMALLRSSSKSDWSEDMPPVAVQKNVQFYGIRDADQRADLVALHLGSTSGR